MLIRRKALALSLPVGNDPPSEFRIFCAGVNSSTKGNAIFDAESAKLVMGTYERCGVDLPIDLDHMMADDPSLSPREDVSDARGWFKLAIRNGELWAVDVTWTPDGARRLQEKTQRYISPLFEYDERTERVVNLLNLALVSMPATHDAPALVAASKSWSDRTSSPLAAKARAAKLLSQVKSNKGKNGS